MPPFVLGLTGSIGMGKSTTAQLFAEAGVPVFDADASVHSLYEQEAVAPVAAVFPTAAVDGHIDRAELGRLVLNDPEAMRKLETIVHPLVRAREEAFMREARLKGAPVVVLDIPLLFEGGGDVRADAVVVVTTDPQTQRSRILERPQMTAEKLDAILARQMPDAEKRARADFVVDTSHGLEPVRVRIREILEQVATMPRRR